MFLGAVICLSFVLCYAGNRPPSIYIEPTNRDIYFKTGETVKIECVADGTPPPRYIWKRNAENFNPSGQDDRVVQLPNQGTLVFNNPEPKDEGIFQCFADNGYGVSASVTVNFKEGILKKFVYEPRRTHRVQAGMDLTLPCTPPQSVPTADVYWVYRSVDGRWEAVNFNRRITMDFEGRLRFTNARKEDEAAGRTYCCMASNYLMRDNAIGPEHQVQVVGVTEYKRPAHELWTSPSDQFFLRGDTLRLKCIFAGSPTPEVYWERLHLSFPDRAAFKSFGQELWITDLEFSDAGQYQCMGLNSQSTQRATKAFNVRIESRPYWVNEPVDIETSVGGTATFICRAEGIPKPDYSWYINGIPLEDRQNALGVKDPRIYNNPRFFKPNKNNMTLIHLTLDDHMNIQCNASNKHGYVFSDVSLSVLAEKPVIIKLPPSEKKVTEGQSVTLECLITGKPDPVVTWYRGNSRITGGRFQIMANGNLHISKVVMADAGSYRCEAYNIYGNVTSSACKTLIRGRTTIKEYPGDLEVITGYNAKFTCSGSTDFNEAKNMHLYWEKDNKRLYDNQQRVTQNVQDNSLTISGTIVRDSGVYTCVVTNGLDQDRAYAILTVKGRPDPPSAVETERCLDESATVKWVKGIENNAPVQYFIIQYNTSFNPDQWVSGISVDYTQNTATIALKPWGNYTFRVIAANKIGTSPPSLHTQKVCRTKPGRPDKNPRNLRSYGDTRNTLKLRWTAMSEQEHNGPGFKYVLTIRELGSSRIETYNINNWKENVIDLPSNRSAYKPFLVRLQAKNSIGDAKEDAIENVLYSFEDMPTIYPYNVEVIHVSDTSAKLSWTWDSVWLTEEGKINEIHGEMKGFKIQYWRTNDKLGSFSEMEVFLEQLMLTKAYSKDKKIISEFVLYRLFPYSNMQVQVRVINNVYAGPPSEKASFTTLEGVPGPVAWFEASSSGSNSITLSWKKPSEEDCNGVLVGYELGFQTVDGLKLGAIQDQVQQINDADAELALLGGLLPARKYRVHIYARTRRGRGEGVFLEVSTISELTQRAPVFDIDKLTSSTITVSLEVETSITEQAVQYVGFRKEGASAWQYSQDKVPRNYVLTSLEPGTHYEIRVVAFDGYTRIYSEIKLVRTAGFATPRAIAANYGWFVVVLTSGVIVISFTVLIFHVYRRRKNVTDKPRYKRGIVIMDAVKMRRFFHHRDSFAKKPLVKDYKKSKLDSKQRRRGLGRRLYRGRLYEGVRPHNKYDDASLSNDGSDSCQDDEKLNRVSNYCNASEYGRDTYSDYSSYYSTDEDSSNEKQDKTDHKRCNDDNKSYRLYESDYNDSNQSCELESCSNLDRKDEDLCRESDSDQDSDNVYTDQCPDMSDEEEGIRSNNEVYHSGDDDQISFEDEEEDDDDQKAIVGDENGYEEEDEDSYSDEDDENTILEVTDSCSDIRYDTLNMNAENESLYTNSYTVDVEMDSFNNEYDQILYTDEINGVHSFEVDSTNNLLSCGKTPSTQRTRKI